MIANVHSRYVDGKLEFFNSADGVTVLQINGPTGRVTVPVGGSLYVNGVNVDNPIDLSTLTATVAEINVLHSVTAGTVLASSGVVVDANKDISAFRNVTCVNLDAGASGTAGSYDVFPTTASKGKVSLTAADS